MPTHSRKSKSMSSGAGGGGSSSSSLPYINASSDSASHLTSTLTPQLYLQRMTDLQQMDLQSAIDQMRILLTLYPQRVYKMAYYRKQTKNHWARDDPAFCFLQILMIAAVSIAYGFAFRVGSILDMIGVVTKSVLVNWLGLGIIIASVGRLIANNHLMMAERSSSHVKQEVEWLYAFDVHCNAFVPLFVLLCELSIFLYSLWYFDCNLYPSEMLLITYIFQIVFTPQMEYSYSYYLWYWDHHFCLWEFQIHYLPLHLGGIFTLLIWDIEHFHSFQILKFFCFLLRLSWYCMCSIMLDIPLDWASMHLG